ncbi:hypothetical protein CBR_g31710 [Chara braunii]|uniref:Retrotransposon gag domain-containing protein n=1 Tax=Chara braunii TaxID=69332 RepID=A0A388JYB0_CHABU|nr:hypothetical protein CBR_g31710 [Chara braunii]|eukprot:GBG62693.1 hypothetical protein CBR_g31710 [Chara braunii]
MSEAMKSVDPQDQKTSNEVGKSSNGGGSSPPSSSPNTPPSSPPSSPPPKSPASPQGKVSTEPEKPKKKEKVKTKMSFTFCNKKDENLLLWIVEIQTYCKMAPVELYSEVAFSTSCLGGDAKEWVLVEANAAGFEDIGEWDGTMNLKQFLGKIKERFLDKMTTDKAFNQLTTIGQRHWTSVEQLSRKVDRLLQEITFRWASVDAGSERGEDEVELLVVQAWRTDVEGDLLGLVFGTVEKDHLPPTYGELLVLLTQLVNDLPLDIISCHDDSPAPHILIRSLASYLKWSAFLESDPDNCYYPSTGNYLEIQEVVIDLFYECRYLIAPTSVEEESSEEEEEGGNTEEESSKEQDGEHTEEEPERSSEEEEERGEEGQGRQEEDPAVVERKRREIAEGKRVIGQGVGPASDTTRRSHTGSGTAK